MTNSKFDESSEDVQAHETEFAETEQLARRALDQDKNDGAARRLWKLSRRAQGKSLGSDLPEAVQKEIYAEHALAVERHLYLDQDLTARLQQAENPHHLVAGTTHDASAQARNFIASKYRLTSFELDLILHAGEKESWPLETIDRD